MKLNADLTWPGEIPPPPFTIHESMVDKLSPDYCEFFKEQLLHRPDILYTHQTVLPALRAGGNVIPGQSPKLDVKSTTDITIPRTHVASSTDAPIPARVFEPKGKKPDNGWPVLLWFHGGGWVLGGIDTENSYCTHVAQLSQCVVITVDYRLAPEDPFPACVDDAFELALFILESGPAVLGIDSTKVAIGGASAGGNLTAVVTHKLASSPFAEKLPPVLFQLLVVPVTDNTASPESANATSWKEMEFSPQLPAAKMLWYRALYLPQGVSDLSKPEASPLFYSDESFSRMPPAFIAASQCDVLRSDAEDYAAKLTKNGVATKLARYQGLPHTLILDDVLDEAKKFVKETTSALKEVFNL